MPSIWIQSVIEFEGMFALLAGTTMFSIMIHLVRISNISRGQSPSILHFQAIPRGYALGISAMQPRSRGLNFSCLARFKICPMVPSLFTLLVGEPRKCYVRIIRTQCILS